MTNRDTLVTDLTNLLGKKLKQLKMSIKDVIREVEEDDTVEYDVIKCYELNKQINNLNRINKKGK